MGQQISTRLASTLYQRLAEAAGGAPTPEVVVALGLDALRRFGLSEAKAESVTDLSQRVLSRRLDIEHLDALDDEAARQALTAVRGVGAWTADMFLIMQLKRQDILPAGDLSIRRAVAQAWQLSTLPSEKEVQTRGGRWSPYRTYAAAVLWESLPAQRAEWARALAAQSDLSPGVAHPPTLRMTACLITA